MLPCRSHKRGGAASAWPILLAALGLLLLSWQAARADAALSELERSPIYRTCERYYLNVEQLRAQERHYLIRDASMAFVAELKGLPPRTKPEARLLLECLNLANGNGEIAFREIQKVEREDDDYIDMALDEANNNANAAQYGVQSRLSDTYDLESDVDLGLETYRSSIVEARALAMQRTSQLFGQLSQAFGQSGQSLETTTFSGSYNAGVQGFIQLAQIATQAYQSFALQGVGGGGGGAPNLAAGGSGITLAPTAGAPAASNAGGSWTAPPAPGAVQPVSTTASPATATSSASATPAVVLNPNAAATAGEDSVVLEAPSASVGVQAGPPSAPKLDPACLEYRITREDVSFARVANDCNVPVSFYWCWVPAGQNSCEPLFLSDIVDSGTATEIAGPGPDQTHVANFVVCNMTGDDQICTR